MASLLLPCVQDSADFGRERGEQSCAFRFPAGAKVIAETHPIEFEAVEVVAFGEFAHEIQVIVADGCVPVIEGAIGPAGEAIGNTAVFGVGAPEFAVDIGTLVIDIVNVVHAHGDPR